MTGMPRVSGMTRIFLTEMPRLRMHPKLSGGRGRGQKGLENCA